MTIQEAVNQYKLTAGKLSFWIPYWINEPGVRSGLYGGKGSPKEIQAETNKIFADYLDPIKTGEEARFLLLRNGLGVDCSGFIYHTLDSYLQSHHKQPLVDSLSVTKPELLKAAQKESWRQHKEFGDQEIKNLPPKVPLRQVCEWFGREPQFLTNVGRLCDEDASVTVAKISGLRVGDLIELKSWSVFPHLGLIISINKDIIEYVSSDFDPLGPGGVAFHQVAISHPEGSITDQDWSQSKWDPVGVRRLKVMA